jgi:hypothetical protein
MGRVPNDYVHLNVPDQTAAAAWDECSYGEGPAGPRIALIQR